MPLPEWVKTQLKGIKKKQQFFKKHKINTVCETLRCPNRSTCYNQPTATFMIMGQVCTRGCRFCCAERGYPQRLDYSEPERIAMAIKQLSLKYVIVTSPTRDDLIDGGAKHFAKTVETIKELNPDTLVEVLVPDFNGDRACIETVLNSGIDVFGHNIETVKRFYGIIRDAVYIRSLNILKIAKEIDSEIITKSGFMLGFGEDIEEVYQILEDLKSVSCDIVTIGQYLQPSKKALPVVEYINPELFDKIAEKAMQIGFKVVISGPLIRSSSKAYEAYLGVKEGKYGKL